MHTTPAGVSTGGRIALMRYRAAPFARLHNLNRSAVMRRVAHVVSTPRYRLAFERAVATMVWDGVVRSHNTGYFTLHRDSTGTWRFVNGSYTAKPAPQP